MPLAAEPDADLLCLACRVERRHFERARALFTYAGPAVSLVRCFKFEGEFFLGERLLRAALRREWLPHDLEGADLIVPVPLHRRRRQERGYDQALLLARPLAAHLGCRLERRALVRSRYTSQQALLPRSRRWDNVRGAFAVKRPARVDGRSVLLVDDVMTTGMTADACAATLRRAGAGRVQVFTLTRAVP
jgi:ComF family protein